MNLVGTGTQGSPLLLFFLLFFCCSNFCVECPSLGSVRNSVCLWLVIDNAAQAALALVSGA